MLRQAGETSATIIVAPAIKRRIAPCSGEVCPGLFWESIPGQPLRTCLKFSSCQSVSLIWAGVSKHLRDFFFSLSADRPRPHRHRSGRKSNTGGFSLPKDQDALKDSKTESAKGLCHGTQGRCICKPRGRGKHWNFVQLQAAVGAAVPWGHNLIPHTCTHLSSGKDIQIDLQAKPFLIFIIEECK